MAFNESSLGFTEEEIIAAGGNPTATAPVIEEIAASSAQIQEAAKGSLDFLAALAMPLIYKYVFPPVLLTVWSWLIQHVYKVRDFSQLALGLPRGFSKTTLMKLFILFCILFTEKKFILIVCEVESKAINILSDVMDMLEEPNIKSVFGDWKLGCETDQQRLKKFGFRGRNIILMAAGAESSIRGITLKNERPDVMLFDDIQSRECADSQIQSENLLRWLVGTAMKAKSPHGCLFLFVANMYPTQWSLLRMLKKNPNWVKFITGGILADGTSLWEDLQPITQLKKEFLNDLAMGRPDIFYAEVLNDENASANNIIDLSRIPPLPYAPGDIPNGNFVVIDPSNNKLTSDYTAIGYCEVYDGCPTLRSVVNDRLSPLATIHKAIEFCLTNNCHLIVVESVAYQATLCYWFQFVFQQMGLTGIEVVEIYPGGRSKNSRILAMLQAYAKGELFVDDSCKAEVHYEITQFQPLKTDNIDNILDLLTYMPRILAEFGEFVQMSSVLIQQEGGAIEVPEYNSCF